MAFFPKEGEVGWGENPVFVGHLASGKSPKLASLTVYLGPHNRSQQNSKVSRKNSGQSRWERPRKSTDNLRLVRRLPKAAKKGAFSRNIGNLRAQLTCGC